MTHQFTFIKDSIYHSTGIFEYNDEYWIAHLKGEDLKVAWKNVTALSLEYRIYKDGKFFIELEERQLVKSHNLRCVYFYFERKDFFELENFIYEHKLSKLPHPNHYQMEYPFVKIYSKHMRQVLNFLTTVMNTLMFLVLFAKLYNFIDRKTGGLTRLQNELLLLMDWFSERIPTTSFIVSLPFLPWKYTFYFIRYLVNSLDEISLVIFYTTTMLIYVFSYWRGIVSSLKLFLNLILLLKRLCNKIKETMIAKKQQNEIKQE
ncbi:hypothetical protein ENUP19_0080G0074 [Entamoeba nuttalli]|uniref:Uncharacterized protein n=2 Tax=Entamoeba nuttalli TaxID=412467 RepID=K2G4P6_ENTNP|nr:hypothetical protein ENU1_203090 [Entamoeba nuttalli P19]EKE37271.1 hypothetical protein ENU1_203090 [Entamoeba nuttalli P19]|eukprot:XP_008860391.1 hypothetical protein ENU1_203090 [Entamoeba nuttalli P19]